MTRIPRPNYRKILPDPLTRREVAALFGVQVQSVSRWDRTLRPFRTPGNHRRWHRDIVVDEYERRLTERRYR